MRRRGTHGAHTWIEPICMECGKLAKAKLVDDAHGKRWRFLCTCGAMVGCHPGTQVPVGRPCNGQTSRARRAAHDALDPFWREKVAAGGNQLKARNAVYKWLARELGLRPEACHIGHMDRETALRVIEICKARRGSPPAAVAKPPAVEIGT